MIGPHTVADKHVAIRILIERSKIENGNFVNPWVPGAESIPQRGQEPGTCVPRRIRICGAARRALRYVGASAADAACQTPHEGKTNDEA